MPSPPLPSESLHPYLPSALRRQLPADLTGLPPEMERHLLTHLTALRDVVVTYLPRHLVAQEIAVPPPEHVRGAFLYGTALFADISGFTAMTEALSHQERGQDRRREGAEKITGIVDDYFTEMLTPLLAYDGLLLKFGGDAIMALFLGEEHALRAIQAALTMQERMHRFRQVEVFGQTFSLRMTVGLGTGPLFAASVGTRERREYAVMGHAVREMAHAEDRAEAGEVIINEEARAAVGDRIVVGPSREGYHPVRRILSSPSPTAPPSPFPPPTSLALAVAQLDRLTPYLPEGLLERLVEGAELEGEFRPVTILFANFYGVDEMIETLGEEGGALIIETLDRHFTTMQGILARYGGVVNKLDTYAVGHRIMALFGAPEAHEDDPERAVRAALEMQAAMEAFQAIETPQGTFPLRQRIGINTGYVVAGNVGSPIRREYTVMGDEVNLAARLMAIARSGQIIVSRATRHWVADLVVCREMEPVRVKGKRMPVSISQVIAVQERVHRRVQTPLVGRTRELDQAQAVADRARRGQGQVLSIVGEAGVGKTRLAEALRDYCQKQGMRVLQGTSLSYATHSPYHPWVELLKACLDLYGDESRSVTASRLLAHLDEVAPRLVDWAPILGQVLGLEVPDNVLTRSLDPQLRQRRLFAMVLEILRIEASHRPLVLILEDMQWMDRASRELLAYVARNITADPILLLLIYRPDLPTEAWMRGEHCTTILLRELPPQKGKELARVLLHAQTLPPLLETIVEEKCKGNPFFIEEITRVLVDSGLLMPEADGKWRVRPDLAQLELPETISGLIISRLDRLPAPERNTLQVASVIGVRFGFDLLHGVYPHRVSEEELRTRLEALEEEGLTLLERVSPVLEYLFRHVLVREVTYETLLFAIRRELHRKIGAYIEEHYADNPAQVYDLLAHHYDQGQRWDKAVHYLLLAGDEARSKYANESAIAYYRRALEIAPHDPRAAEAYRSLGDVYQHIGRYEEALRCYRQALEVAGSSEQRASLLRRIARAYERQGRYDRALEHLHRAMDLLREEPASLEVSRIYGAMGWVLMRRGEYDQALEYCGRGLEYLKDWPEDEGVQRARAELYHTLGSIASSRGNYAEAIEFHEESIRLREALQDLPGLANSYNNLAFVYWQQGQYDQTSAYLHRSLEIRQRIGESYGIAASYNNLGTVSYKQGRYQQAVDYYRRSLALRQEMGDRWGMAQCYSNLGEAALRLGDYKEAEGYLREAIEGFAALGSKPHLIDPHRNLSEVLLIQGRPEEALEHAEAARQLADALDNQPALALAWRTLAAAYAQLDDPRAEEAYRKSIALLEEAGDPGELARAWAGYGRWLMEQGQAQDEGETIARGRACLERAAELFTLAGKEEEARQVRELLGR